MTTTDDGPQVTAPGGAVDLRTLDLSAVDPHEAPTMSLRVVTAPVGATVPDPDDDLLGIVRGSGAPLRRTASLRVALVGEGAYPVGPGGVSLWCHQLVEGMPEHAFTAVALTVDGSETVTWNAPENLARVVNLPLWGPDRLRRPRLRRAPVAFARAHEAFLVELLHPVEGPAPVTDGPGAFEDALRAMLGSARRGDLSGELVTDEVVQRLLDLWPGSPLQESLPEGRRTLTVRDAVAVTRRFEHLLRPLSHPAPDVDVVHLSMGGVSTLVALRARWDRGTPVVLSEHGVYLRERYLGLAADHETVPVRLLTTRFHRALTEAAYRTADALAPHSSFNRRWQVYGGGAPDRMQTMYNGIDPVDFPAAQGEPDVPTIVFVGRVDRLKDLHTLIRAFGVVRQRIPDARLRIFGPVTKDNEEYHRSCLALVDELGLTGAATFEGRIARTVDAYAAGHLVALTSVSEGFPFTIIESMSTGRPQVATDVGGVAEAVGDAGFVVPPRDHEAVAEACVTLLTDADLRRVMGERARRRVLDSFTLSRWTDAYREIYAALVPGVRPRHAGSRPALLDVRREAPDVVDLTAAEVAL